MTVKAPEGVRQAARVLLLGARERLLLLQAEDPATNAHFWVTPGGGVQPGESFEAAAARELREETGLSPDLGPCVWTRRHRYVWGGRELFDVYERFFVAITDAETIAPERPDSYVKGYRWWTLPEIHASADEFAPRRLGAYLPDIIAGRFPAEPIDCGI